MTSEKFLNMSLAHLEGLFKIPQLDEELEQKVDVLVSDVGRVLERNLINEDSACNLQSNLS